jgi:hypothetical protein
MKMRILLTLLVSVLWVSAVEARTPDNDDIYAKIADSASPYYYPNLKMRYDQWVEPLTGDELHYLYYGYAYQSEYKPLDNNPYHTRVLEIMARIAIEEPAVSDLDELVMTAMQSYERDPFSPQILNILAYAYGALGDKGREQSFYERLNGGLEVIASSGDGLKERSAMHITMFSHALDYIASKGWTYGKSRVISRTVEYVPFVVARNKVKGYYFDFSRIYWNKPENYTFKRERTWQFNNLKPREYK